MQRISSRRVIKYKPREYHTILKDIKFLLGKAKAQAYKAVDNIRVQTYWQIGERIVREELQHEGRADYGQKIIDNLADDLGFRRDELYRVVQFYKSYPIVVTVSQQLSWSHYVELIKLSSKTERATYERLIIQNTWSIRELRKQIKKHTAKTYKLNMVKVSQPATQLTPREVFKDSYNFDFLELKKDFKEKDLKDALLSKFEDFIKELGYGFFVGRREVPILIAGNYDKVDLELFHTGLMCYVLVEVKTEPFKHSHVSQMYSYLNWYKENKLIKGQRMPIGLIICKTKDQETIRYALGDLKKEIFISEYQVKLPSEKEIIQKVCEEK